MKLKESERTRAEKTGRTAEVVIKSLLTDKGYGRVPWHRFEAAKALGQPVYATQYPNGKSIYETDLKADYILWHPERHPDTLIIESKWQQTGGTTDEKYPYFVMNIKLQPIPKKTIVILDGGGYRPGAGEWLKKQQGGNLLHVFTLADFIAWANRNNI